MTVTDIMHTASRYGYAYDIAARAIDYYRDEQRTGGGEYWDDRGPLSLLEAVNRDAEHPVVVPESYTRKF